MKYRTDYNIAVPTSYADLLAHFVRMDDFGCITHEGEQYRLVFSEHIAQLDPTLREWCDSLGIEPRNICTHNAEEGSARRIKLDTTVNGVRHFKYFRTIGDLRTYVLELYISTEPQGPQPTKEEAPMTNPYQAPEVATSEVYTDSFGHELTMNHVIGLCDVEPTLPFISDMVLLTNQEVEELVEGAFTPITYRLFFADHSEAKGTTQYFDFTVNREEAIRKQDQIHKHNFYSWVASRYFRVDGAGPSYGVNGHNVVVYDPNINWFTYAAGAAIAYGIDVVALK